jgi:U3 small nucleolar RNA-associated protein 11
LDSEADTVKSQRKHTVFVDSRKEAVEFDVAEHFDTIPEFAGRSFNRLRRSDIEKLAGTAEENESKRQTTVEKLKKQAKEERKLARKLAKARSNAYGELEARRKRAEAMAKAEGHLVTEKLVASKGRKRKIKAAEGGQPAQYKWRRKRLG